MKLAINFSLLLLTLNAAVAFKAYWNVPSQMCQKFGIFINASKWHIIQNSDDRYYYGEKVRRSSCG